jgi:dTDP-4-dehydrorhamnose 3,5-epimerase
MVDITDLSMEGLKLVKRHRLGDSRGYLSRMFCADALVAAGWTKPIVQINQTKTSRCGTVRGMHYQCPPHAEMKLVSCIRGEVWDVAVDLRTGSKTFLHWHAERLSADNQCAMLIPEGFAHGFQSLTDDAELIYLHTSAYNAMAETGLSATDPRLAIEWPLKFTELSLRDAQHPVLNGEFIGVEI